MENKFDEMFELMSKMYGEMQNGFKKVDERFEKLESRASKIETTLENDIKPKVFLCLDELVNVKEILQEHNTRFDRIEEKLEKHDIEINVVRKAI